ncbi:unnamed protein product [Aspergillus oryzae]|nr:unnamed protein product [Aspergillus oryzae]
MGNSSLSLVGHSQTGYRINGLTKVIAAKKDWNQGQPHETARYQVGEPEPNISFQQRRSIGHETHHVNSPTFTVRRFGYKEGRYSTDQ